MRVLTGVAGGAGVPSATAVAAEVIPSLRAAATVLAVVWNTPGDGQERSDPGGLQGLQGALAGPQTCLRWHTCPG